MREYQYWTLSLNPVQHTLGTLLVKVKRPVERLCDLLPEELEEWQKICKSCEKALLETFHPNRLNYLQMDYQKPIAMLIMPRYSQERNFAGKSWKDGAYGDFPAMKEKNEASDVQQAISKAIVDHLKPWDGEDNMTIYFLRHGETEFSQKGILEGNQPLNDAGRSQTLKLKERLGSFPFDLCAISNSLQTSETAHLLLGSVPQIQDERLRERDWGVWEGRSISDLRRANPSEIAGVETPESIAVRLSDFMNEMALMHSGLRILAITHGWVLRVLVARLLGFSNLNADIGITYYSFVKVNLIDGRWSLDRMDNILLPTTIEFRCQPDT